jgi:soluble cytochrome b562
MAQKRTLTEYLKDYDQIIKNVKSHDMHHVLIDELEKNRNKIGELNKLAETDKQKRRLTIDVSKFIDLLLERTDDGDEVATYGALRQIRDAAFYAEIYLTQKQGC